MSARRPEDDKDGLKGGNCMKKIGENVKNKRRLFVFTLVRSMPSRTWDSRCMMTLLCSSTDSPSPSSSLSSWLSNRSEKNTQQTLNIKNNIYTYCWPKVRNKYFLNVFERSSYAHQDCIYLIKNIVKSVILWFGAQGIFFITINANQILLFLF